jgi:hypothetical protein
MNLERSATGLIEITVPEPIRKNCGKPLKDSI